MQNGHMKIFDRRLSKAFLNEHLSPYLRHARHLILTWRDEKENERLRKAVSDITLEELVLRPACRDAYVNHVKLKFTASARFACLWPALCESEEGAA